MLTFDVLREANVARAKHYKNGRGEVIGSSWGLSSWSNACLGELGEAANIIKKIERCDFTLDQKREELAKEFADVVIYLDLLANAAGIDLGKAVREKFNEVSGRVGSSVFIEESQRLVRTVHVEHNGFMPEGL